MTVAIQEGIVTFAPRARIIKLLGGELIRDEVMAIMELVKNAHDADAGQVVVSFDGVSGSGGEIVITDDGLGMSRELLLGHWMQPAASSKRSAENRRTYGGRRILGEKGVGRFSVDRLGRYCELISRQPSADTEIVTTFDWDAFDREETLLSDIPVSWMERRASAMDGNGTRIRIWGLRQEWTQRAFRRLSSRLQRLLSPFDRTDAFRIEIRSDEFPEYSGLLRMDLLDRAPYTLRADFDGLGKIAYEMNGTTGATAWPGPGYLSCGPLRIELRAFDLETDGLKRVGNVLDVRAWLREWSGISIYRDGFRVLPYGEPDDDWLRLDQRRVNNPVQRFSNNQICGTISMGGDTNPELRDQTNRGGLIQSAAFDDLRRLTLFCLELLEGCRREIRDRAKQKAGLGSAVAGRTFEDSLSRIREQLAGNSKRLAVPLVPAIDALGKMYQDERDADRRSLKLHAELASIGHNATYMSHMLRPPVADLRAWINGFADGKMPDPTSLMTLASMVGEMEDAINLLEPLAATGIDVGRTVDLVDEVRSFALSVDGMVRSQGGAIEFREPVKGLCLVDGRRDLVVQLLHILLRNSLQAMVRAADCRVRLRIRRGRGDTCVLSVMDRGPGVPDADADRVFESGFTTREGARGMGLTLARLIVADLRGEIRISRTDGRWGWFSFDIVMPLSSLVF